ncbi:MAG: type II toxin-antitoxin system VapC family toxin [Bacteroidia bacterium]|jgi:hypothetical protein|nr:type II toxin-antitoxin system VapC family toxin [Bacteroidia bacterium]
MTEAAQYLLDSGIILDYLSDKLPKQSVGLIDEAINLIPNISVITKIELLSLNIPDEYQQVITGFLGDAIVLDLSVNVVKNTVAISKTHHMSMNEAIIAATAITYGYTLLSSNMKIYENIRGLKVLNPHDYQPHLVFTNQ